jgi:hypothetical protein
LYNPGKTGTFLHFKGFSSREVIQRFSSYCDSVVRREKFLWKIWEWGSGPPLFTPVPALPPSIPRGVKPV